MYLRDDNPRPFVDLPSVWSTKHLLPGPFTKWFSFFSVDVTKHICVYGVLEVLVFSITFWDFKESPFTSCLSSFLFRLDECLVSYLDIVRV